MLVGAGRAGVLAAKEIMNRGDLPLEILGFVDDDPDKGGSVIQGVKVIGTTGDLPRLVPELGIDHVVITIAQAERKDIRRIIESCDSVPVKARIIPGLYEILSGTVEVKFVIEWLDRDKGQFAVRLAIPLRVPDSDVGAA